MASEMNVSARRLYHRIPAAPARTAMGSGCGADQSFGWIWPVVTGARRSFATRLAWSWAWAAVGCDEWRLRYVAW